MARGNDERDNPNRRPQRPIIRFDNLPTDNPEMPHGSLGKSMAEMIKQAVYDSEFNDIVGLPNDIVAEPNKDEK